MNTVTLGIDQQRGGIPFYNTEFDIVRKYLRLNILNHNKNKTFEEEADDFTSDLGYKWSSKLGDMLTQFIAKSRISKKDMSQPNFKFWKEYFLSKGFTLWQITEFYRAFNEEVKAGTIKRAIKNPWDYDPTKDKSIYALLGRYALIGIGVYVGVPALIKLVGGRK